MRSRPASNKRTGDAHELRLMRETGLQRVPGSGCGSFFRGDLGTPYGWFVEAKSRTGTDFRFQPRWWEKAVQDARKLARPNIALAYHFTDHNTYRVFEGFPADLLIMPMTEELEQFVDGPFRYFDITTKETRIPVEVIQEDLERQRTGMLGSLGLTFKAKLDPLTAKHELVVTHGSLLQRVIAQTT